MTMLDELLVGSIRLRLTQGDIVQIGTEAIVNAANSSLAGGGGVDGAIHRAAGPVLYELTKPFGGCPTGSAVITSAGHIPLPTRYIIHAVGPVYNPFAKDKVRGLLASAYRKSLELAQENAVKSVAFPAISTGIYGYPIKQAAPVALQTALGFVKEHPNVLQEVVFVLFSSHDLEVYRTALAELNS